MVSPSFIGARHVVSSRFVRIICAFALLLVVLLSLDHPSRAAQDPDAGNQPPVICPGYSAGGAAANLAPSLGPAPLSSGSGLVGGSFAVSPGGAATYTVALKVPPGIAGMEPSVSIAYNSNAGDGPVGMGFSLAGHSLISRCPKNVSDDGQVRAVMFDPQDNLCLDGARLVEIWGGFHYDLETGDIVREYRTVPDSFSRVFSYEPIDWPVAKGPQRFKVYERSGRIVEYGNTADSRVTVKAGVVADWWVNRVSDRRDNAMVYSYDAVTDGETHTMTVSHVPSRIAYTSHPGQAPMAAVAFDYHDLQDTRTLHRGGASISQSKRLFRIRMLGAADTLVRDYRLSYDGGAVAGRALLQTLSECVEDAGANLVCRPPISFRWKNGGGFQQPVAAFNVNVPSQGSDHRYQWWLRDVTGDGLADFVFSKDAEDGFNEWWVAKNVGSGAIFAPPTLWMKWAWPSYPVGSNLKWEEAYWTDYNHDGRSDVVLSTWNASISDMPNVVVLLAGADGSFHVKKTPVLRHFVIDGPTDGVSQYMPQFRAQQRLVDVNGDGADDLLRCYNPAWDSGGTIQDTTGPGHWSVHLWSADLAGFDPSPIAGPEGIEGMSCGVLYQQKVYVVDVDGDGAAELVAPRLIEDAGAIQYATGYHAYSLSGDKWIERDLALPRQKNPRRLHFLDMNGDGLSDALYTGQGITRCDNPGDPPPYYLEGSDVTDPMNIPLVGGIFAWCPTDDTGELSMDLPLRIDNLGGRLPFAAGSELGPDTQLPNYHHQTPLGNYFGQKGTFHQRPIPHSSPGVDEGIMWTDRLADQGQVVDFNGDGLQDLFVPMAYGCGVGAGSAPCWVIWESDGHGYFNVRRFSDFPGGLPDIPGMTSNAKPIAPRFRPATADLNGDGREDILAFTDQDSGIATIFLSGGPFDLLSEVDDGSNPLDSGNPGYLPSVAITYDTMIDRSMASLAPMSAAAQGDTTYRSRADAANDCSYTHSCAAGSSLVVSRYAFNNGANKARKFAVQYRDGRVDGRGRRSLGFGSVVQRDLDTGAGKVVFNDNITYDGSLRAYPYAGQPRETWSWAPGLVTQPQPLQFNVTYDSRLLVTISTNDGKSYFTGTAFEQVEEREGLYDPGQTLYENAANKQQWPLVSSSLTVQNLDAFGNVTFSHFSNVEADVSIDTHRTVANLQADWLLGEVTDEVVCSAAGGETQCRGTHRDFDELGSVKTASRVDGGDPSAALEISYSRDAFGHVIKTTARDGLGGVRQSCVSYDANHQFPYARSNAPGHISYTSFDPALGALLSSTDENGLRSRWQYDRMGNMVKSVLPNGPNPRTTTVSIRREKDGGPGVWWVGSLGPTNWWNTKIATTTDGGGESLTRIDSTGRVVHTRTRGADVEACSDPENPTTCTNTPWFDRDIEYDDLGHVSRRSTTYIEDHPQDIGYEVLSYDALGRVIHEKSPWGHVSKIIHLQNFVTTQDEQEPGKVFTRQIIKDALGRPVLSMDDLGGATKYVYGPFGAKKSVEPPDGLKTTYEYDTWGRLRKQIDPDRGMTSYTSYNGFDELLAFVDEKGRGFQLGYDLRGRLVQRQDPEGVSTWVYGANGKPGLLASTTSATGVVKSYAYDAYARPLGSSTTIGGSTYASGVVYDDSQLGFGRVESIVYPGIAGQGQPLRARYDHDSHGNVLKISDKDDGKALWELKQLNGQGAPSKEWLGNGVTSTFDRDPKSARLESLLATGPAGKVQDLKLTYDARLNLKSRKSTFAAPGIHFAVENFVYDGDDRLTCSYFNSNANCDQSVTYDAAGNIVSKSDVSAAPYVYGDAAHPHAVTAAGADLFQYDAVGNQTVRPNISLIEYSSFDLPRVYHHVGGATTELDYDADGQRVRKSNGLSDTIYVGSSYEHVTEKGTNVVTEKFYLPLGSSTLVVSRSNAVQERLYVLSDQLGSPEVVTDELGGVKQRLSYDAWGRARNPTWGSPVAPAASVTSMGFTGHEDEAELGLVNMKGRIYDPHIARFLMTDPVVSAPLFGQSWNPYGYVLNNPLRWVDPSGFEPAPALLMSEMPNPCSGCKGGVTTDGVSTSKWVEIKVPAPAPAPTPAGGRSLRDHDARATADGAGGGAPDPRLSAGTGGADSGERTYAQLVPADHAGFQKNVREQSHQWGLMALLAPVKYPVVVGAIAFGLFDPDPAYAPNFDTEPEDRPSDLARLGGTGLAVAIGAAGIKLGQLGGAAAKGAEAGSAGAANAAAEVRMVNPRVLRPTEALSSKSQAAKMSKLMGGEKGFGPFAPIDAIESDGVLYIIDGHHRTVAATRARLSEVPVRVRPVSSAEEAKQLIRDWAATLSDKGF